jgi:hypothetical protein
MMKKVSMMAKLMHTFINGGLEFSAAYSAVHVEFELIAHYDLLRTRRNRLDSRSRGIISLRVKQVKLPQDCGELGEEYRAECLAIACVAT